MRTPCRLVLILLLVSGCGGGGGGGGPSPEPDYVALTSTKVDAPSPSYRATFAVTGRVQVVGAIAIDVAGTYTIESASGTATSPTNGLVGSDLVSTISLTAGTATYDVPTHEYVWHDAAGRRWSLGYEGPTGERAWYSGATFYLIPLLGSVDGRLLLLEAEIETGRQTLVPPTKAVAETDGTDLLTRAFLRNVTGTEILDTPLGRYECYKVGVTETVTPAGAGATPVVVVSTRWERPDMGLLKVSSDGLPFLPAEIPVEVLEFEAVITSYTP